MRRRRTVLLAVLGAPLALLALLVAAWAIDTAALGGEVVRNVSLAGHRVGGMSEGDVLDVVGEVAEDYREAPIEIATPDGTLEATAAELGLTLDEPATVAATLDVGHTSALPVRPFSWVRSFVDDWRAPLRFSVSEAELTEAVIALEGDRRTHPVEPAIAAEGPNLTVVPGQPGTGLDIPALAEDLPQAAAEGDLPIVVQAQQGPVPPRFSDEDAQALVDEASRLTAGPFRVRAEEAVADVPIEMLRTWVVAVPGPDALGLAVNGEKVIADLDALLSEAGTPPVNAGFDVAGDAVAVRPGADGTGCCQPDAPDRIFEALGARVDAVELALVPVPPERTTEEAETLGVVQKVSEFTTAHAAGESRVANIHRIADIVRGVVVEPGQTFSVNDHVGQRTVSSGFVEAGVIYQGEFTTDVGGGVSQFATTIFNAAFFAGLDFAEYQSHSIYISRYPRGREATISYPSPDLKLVNNSPHGILIWPTYTNSTITVAMYSTPWVNVVASEPVPSPEGSCTRWTTTRTRTFLADGRVENDSVFAVYRPAEGVDC